MNMKRLFNIVLGLSFVTICAFAKNSTDTLRVLAIGNSFSIDAMEYLDTIAKSQNKCLIYGNIIKGGCSLERHANNIKESVKEYSYIKSVLGERTTTRMVNLNDFIDDEKWNCVSIQQVSHLQGMYDSYYPYTKEIISFLKNELNWNFQIYFHQTWAYPVYSEHKGFKYYHNDQREMLDSINVNVSRVTKQEKIKKIFFSGNAIQLLRETNGESVNRDGFHLNVLGRYAAACVWYETLFKESALKIKYKPSELSEEEALAAKKAAHTAVKKGFKVNFSK